MKKTPNKLNKSCFWRHGAFTDVKISEYWHVQSKNKDDLNYKTKRIISLQRCGFCGKIIFRCNTNDSTD